MKPWHNSSSQPSGNRMNSWHPQMMQPSNHAPSSFPCFLANQHANGSERHTNSSACPPIRQNMNFYWQDQRRVSMPTHPGIQSHIHPQQNISMTMTHQQRHYQQPAEFCQSNTGYHQGRNGNECRNYHCSSQPPSHQFSVQTPYHHQQQYPMGPPNMMMPYQQQQQQYQHQHQHQHAPTSMYQLPNGSPSFNCQTGSQSGHHPMHPPMMIPNYYNTCAETYCQRRGLQPSHMGSTTDEHHFRHSLSSNHGKNMITSPSQKFQNVRNFGGLRQSKVLVLDNMGDLKSKKDLFVFKKNVKAGRESRRSWSSVVGGTSKEESAKMGTSCESDVDTDSGSFGNSMKNSVGTLNVAEATSGVVRQILTRPNVCGKVTEVFLKDEQFVKKGSGVGDVGKKDFFKEGSFFADNASHEEKRSEIILNFVHKEEKSEEKTKVCGIDTRESTFLKPSCQLSLGVIYEKEQEKEHGKFGTETGARSEKSASELDKIRVLSILEKVAEELKVSDDPLNYRSLETAKKATRVSRAVSREPRLKEIRNKWNISNKFGDRKSRASSRRTSQRRANSNDSPKASLIPFVRSLSQTSIPMIEVSLDTGTTQNTLSTTERRPCTEKGYEYDINIDDMVNNICHSSTPSFTSSEDCPATQEKGDNEIVESENEKFRIKAFTDDEYCSEIEVLSGEDCSGFEVEENDCSSRECAAATCDGQDVGVESIRAAFQNLSASITAIKDRLEETASEPHKLIQETEASFLKFQKSYLMAKTAFQKDKFKYPTDIHYDEISKKSGSFRSGQSMHQDYEIIIDYKKCFWQKTETQPLKKDYVVSSKSRAKFKEMHLNYASYFNIDRSISYEHNPLLNYNYYGQLNIDGSSSHFESRAHFDVTYGANQYQNSKEEIFSALHLPQSNNNFKIFPGLQFSYQHPHCSDQQDKVEDVDPNTIDFNTNEMKEDTISASSSESTIRLKVKESEEKILPKETAFISAESNQCYIKNDECEPCEYLRPGIYPELPKILQEFCNERKEDAEETHPISESNENSEKPSYKDNEPGTNKQIQSDRGSYLQPGVKQKSLVEMMKNSGGVDKNVPFSIKQLETRNLEAAQNKEESSEKCENWLADNVNPSIKTKRIPSLFEVQISGVFNTRQKADRQKPSTSSYGSGDAPCHFRRHVSNNRNGSRSGSKKLGRRNKAVPKGLGRRKEEVTYKEVVKGQSPGQQWQAIAPGMYRNVNQEKEEIGVDREKSTSSFETVIEVTIDKEKVLNRHKENPPPLSKILASARKNMDED